MTTTGLLFAQLQGWSVAVDERSQVSFSIAQGTLPWQPIFVGLSAFFRGVQLLQTN